MNRAVVVPLALSLLLAGTAASAGEPTVEQLLERVGLKPAGDTRGQMDVVGFASDAAQMRSVLEQAEMLAEPRRKEIETQKGLRTDAPFAAAVCPHDDYYYAARLYALLVPHIKAPRVIILGVFHKARVFGARDRLVFDSFRHWHAPAGPVPVSTLRQELIAELPEADYLVDNDMQMVEHSVEAIVAWLQAYHPQVEIVSILVPYMDWQTLDGLAARLAGALDKIMDRHGWRLGRDVALVSSSDAVHYGDAQWGGKNFAPFGTGLAGYRRAVARDRGLVRDFLAGPLRRERLHRLLDTLVDPRDVTRYRITWCGRFSVPFGLNVAARLAQRLEGRRLTGLLLDYGTSVSEASLDTTGLGRLGPTAPNNFHHFVGYAAIGYR